VNNATRTIRIKLGSSWEEQLLEEERKDPDFLCWLRNPPRKEWSLAIPYVMNGAWKTAYPDFLIIKENDETGISVDILEPHDPSKTDNLPKAKGFAKYAKENMQVNSIQLIRQLPDKTSGKPKLKRLDLSDYEVQERIALANSDEDLTRIFEEKGFVAEYHGLFQE
jgi:type III restriction enzyme